MTRPRFSLLVAPLVLSILTMGCATTTEPSEPTTQATATAMASATATAEPTPEATDSPSASPTESEDAEADEARVTIGAGDFAPATLTISVGTEVVFETEAPFEHTVTEGTGGQAVDDPIVDSQVAAGGEVSVVFDEPGTYDITCTIHPSMQMTITVEE
jgi:plastocyanin